MRVHFSVVSSAQAIEFRELEKLGKGLRIVYLTIRRIGLKLTKDRVLSQDNKKLGKRSKTARSLKKHKNARCTSFY